MSRHHSMLIAYIFSRYWPGYLHSQPPSTCLSHGNDDSWRGSPYIWLPLPSGDPLIAVIRRGTAVSKVKAPVLIMHVRGDTICPFDSGRELAAGNLGAHFIALAGRNHLFREHEPACVRFFEEIILFLKG